MRPISCLRHPGAALVFVTYLATVVAANEPKIRQSVFDVPAEFPSNVTPLEYDIKLTFLDDFTLIKGRADISFKFNTIKSSIACLVDKVLPPWRRKNSDAISPSNSVLLQLDRRLAMTHIGLLVAGSEKEMRAAVGRKVAIKEVLMNYGHPVVAIRLEKSLPSGSFGRLFIKYQSTAQRPIKLHPGEIYDAAEGVNNTYRALQLEPGHARELFPCFDEPKFKTKMSLTVRRPFGPAELGVSLVSNMPMEKDEILYDETIDGGMLVQVYRSDVPMPVHSLAFAMGRYSTRRKAKKANVEVFEPAGHSGEGSFAVISGSKFMRWFQRYLKLEHPMKSLKLVAVPSSDMWNVGDALGIGLINHEYLLIDEKLSSPERKIEAALNVALVVARQWFGYVLVPKSQDDLWITEGLAFHLAVRAVRELMPDFKIDQYVKAHHRSQVYSIELNSCFNSISQPSYIDGTIPTFNLVRLVRGAEIFDMLRRNIVGDQRRFDEIVRSLVSGKASEGVQLSGLAKAFANEKFSSEQIEEVIKMRTIIGCDPWVLVGDTGIWVTLRKTYPRGWDVPVAYTLQFFSADESMSSTREVAITDYVNRDPTEYVDFPAWFARDRNDWFQVVLDDEQALPYHRVHYSENAIGRLRNAAENGLMGPSERANLIGAELDLRLGRLMSSQRLETSIRCFANERDPDVLLEVVRALRVGGNPFVFDAPLKRIHKELGGFSTSGSESISEQRLKSAVATLLVELEDQPVVKEALAKFDSAGDQIVGYLREPVYTAVGAFGSAAQRERLAKMLEAASFGEERARLLRAIRGPVKIEYKKIRLLL